MKHLLNKIISDIFIKVFKYFLIIQFILFIFFFVGLYQCLVQLSTMPVAVCYGAGTTMKEAQSNAAHNALEYLKLMTKK